MRRLFVIPVLALTVCIAVPRSASADTQTGSCIGQTNSVYSGPEWGPFIASMAQGQGIGQVGPSVGPNASSNCGAGHP